MVFLRRLYIAIYLFILFFSFDVCSNVNNPDTNFQFKDWKGKEKYYAIYDKSNDYRMCGYLIISPIDYKMNVFQAIFHSLVPGGGSEQIDMFLNVTKINKDGEFIKGGLHIGFGDEMFGFENKIFIFKRNQRGLLVYENENVKEYSKNVQIGIIGLCIPVLESMYKKQYNKKEILLIDPSNMFFKNKVKYVFALEKKIEIELPGNKLLGSGYICNKGKFIFNNGNICTDFESPVFPIYGKLVKDLTKAKRQLKNYKNLSKRTPRTVIEDAYTSMYSGDDELFNASVSLEYLSKKLKVTETELKKMLLSGVLNGITGINPSNFKNIMFLDGRDKGDLYEIDMPKLNTIKGSNFSIQSISGKAKNNKIFTFVFKKDKGWKLTNFLGLNNEDDYKQRFIDLKSFNLNILAQTAKYDESIKLIDETLNFIESNYGKNCRDYALFLNNKAFIMFKKEQFVDAEKLYIRSIEIYKKNNLIDENYLTTIYTYTQLCKKLKKDNEAEKFLKEYNLLTEKF